MPKEHVFHVQHQTKDERGYHLAVTDLIFRGGQPIAVLVWAGEPGSEYPLVSVRLDPSQLQEFPAGRVQYFYHDLIEVPPILPEKPE